MFFSISARLQKPAAPLSQTGYKMLYCPYFDVKIITIHKMFICCTSCILRNHKLLTLGKSVVLSSHKRAAAYCNTPVPCPDCCCEK